MNNLTENEKKTAIRRVDAILAWHGADHPISSDQARKRINEHRKDMAKSPETQAQIDLLVGLSDLGAQEAA